MFVRLPGQFSPLDNCYPEQDYFGWALYIYKSAIKRIHTSKKYYTDQNIQLIRMGDLQVAWPLFGLSFKAFCYPCHWGFSLGRGWWWRVFLGCCTSLSRKLCLVEFSSAIPSKLICRSSSFENRYCMWCPLLDVAWPRYGFLHRFGLLHLWCKAPFESSGTPASYCRFRLTCRPWYQAWWTDSRAWAFEQGFGKLWPTKRQALETWDIRRTSFNGTLIRLKKESFEVDKRAR